MNRGVNRQAIFADDRDREYFSQTVTEYKEICGARVYHWAWMGNHYHLLVEVIYKNLRTFVGGLQQVYAQYHHARHRSCGIFWQGRFKSKPVEVGAYLVSCGRYIERNPVRAGLVTEAWDYSWSSAAVYVNGVDDGLTDVNPYWGKFTAQGRRIYADALKAEDDESIMRAIDGSHVIGSPGFVASLKTEHGRWRLKRGRPAKVRE